MPLTPDRDGLWTNKRLPDHVAPVEEVTWVADDGIRYLNPEIVLMYKARLGRLKDTRDLDRAWPLMDDRARAWLREKVALAAPRPRLARAAVLREPSRPPDVRWRTTVPGGTHEPSPASAALAACAAVLVLAGCGQATDPAGHRRRRPRPPIGSRDDTAGGGVSGSSGTIDPDPSLAQWPATGCEARSVVSVDYGRMPTGFDTPEEAVENSPAVGLPDGVLALAPYAGKGPAQVWVVDPETDEIQAQVSVFRGPDGWFVDA